MSTSEPFPLLSTAVEQLHSSSTENGTARRRRKSSTLLEQLPAGDTGAPGLATSLAHLGVARSHHYVKVRAAIASSVFLDGCHELSGSQGRATQDPKEGTSKRLSRRRKARSLLRRAKSFATRHTWVIPFVLLFLFGSLYAVNPTSSNPIHAFIFLSYEIPRTPGMAADAPTQYGKGLWDVAFVSFYIVVLSFTREFIMQELLRPLARYAGLRRTKQARFMEQVYSAIYFGILGPAGMWVMSRSPVWYFNTAGMYEGSPHKTLNAEFKFYYLFQAAYWAQQAIVLLLGMEKPRKDFKELVGHHIVSLTMIGLSYRFHFTHIGLAVYITHDISDFFLAVRQPTPNPFSPPSLEGVSVQTDRMTSHQLGKKGNERMNGWQTD
jgi:acyl-CoA-dependent ceramide synthase